MKQEDQGTLTSCSCAARSNGPAGADCQSRYVDVILRSTVTARHEMRDEEPAERAKPVSGNSDREVEMAVELEAMSTAGTVQAIDDRMSAILKPRKENLPGPGEHSLCVRGQQYFPTRGPEA